MHVASEIEDINKMNWNYQHHSGRKWEMQFKQHSKPIVRVHGVNQSEKPENEEIASRTSSEAGHFTLITQTDFCHETHNKIGVTPSHNYRHHCSSIIRKI